MVYLDITSPAYCSDYKNFLNTMMTEDVDILSGQGIFCYLGGNHYLKDPS